MDGMDMPAAHGREWTMDGMDGMVARGTSLSMSSIVHAMSMSSMSSIGSDDGPRILGHWQR